MDVYGMVTERIIEQLEHGYIPWKKPWASCLDGTFNRISRKPYSLLNQLLLSRGGEYATFRQWDQIGGKIKKGEKAEIVVFWKLQEAQEKDETGEIKIKKIPILRYYNVFHISQIENVFPLPKTEEFETKPIERAEKTLHDYLTREQITLSVGADRAFYSPYTDSITLPAITQFECAEEYYGTAFHECGHSTLKESRCNREAENRSAVFGSEDYSKEELVAEITSAAILHSMGMETAETFKNSAAYIQNWLQVLRNDRKFIVSASGKAEKAAKYILNITE
jgi:antirestriction protein ArdC